MMHINRVTGSKMAQPTDAYLSSSLLLYNRTGIDRFRASTYV